MESETITSNLICPLYVKYKKKKAEYRVHVFDGKIMDVQQKKKRRGVEHGAAKLTEKDVLAIRAKYIPRIYSTTRLAAEYKVNRTTIFNIISKKHWKHI